MKIINIYPVHLNVYNINFRRQYISLKRRKAAKASLVKWKIVFKKLYAMKRGHAKKGMIDNLDLTDSENIE